MWCSEIQKNMLFHVVCYLLDEVDCWVSIGSVQSSLLEFFRGVSSYLGFLSLTLIGVETLHRL